MKILLDYDILEIPGKDQIILDVFTHVKAEILRAIEYFDEKYNSVYVVISISKEGLNIYYLSVNSNLADEFNNELGKLIDLSKIAGHIWSTKNN